MSYDLYERLGGEVYDLLYSHQQDDLRLWERLAIESWITKGAPVLELAVGTGRIAIPLARRRVSMGLPNGPGIHGVDISRHMLARAKEKLSKEDEQIRCQVVLLQSDMRELPKLLSQAVVSGKPLPNRFGLIFIALNSFLHLTTYEDQLRTLKGIREVLQPGSLFVFEVFNPDPLRLVDKEDPVLDIEHYDETLDRRVMRYEQNRRVDRTKQKISATHHVVIEEKGQRIVDRYVHFEIAYLWPRDIELLCRDAGLIITERWYDYRMSSFESMRNPPRQIVVCQRKE